MTALLLILGIAVQPLAVQEVEGVPVTPVDAARSWLAALGDLKADCLSALTAYPFRWTLEWRPHEVPRKGARRLPRPVGGRDETCPVFVRSATLMPAWLTCMRVKKAVVVLAARRHELGKGEAIAVALESRAGPKTARLQGDDRIVWVVASLTGKGDEAITVRLGVRRNDHGEFRVERAQTRVDFVYDEERLLSEQRQRKRHHHIPQ